MRQNRLLNLLASNRRKGEFRAEAGPDGNIIFLYDQIVATEDDAYWFGGVAADTFVKTLLAMDGPVLLRINSPGGDVFASRAMAQAIREYPDQITARVDGYAASAASFLTSVADRTEMAPGAMLMIHKAWTTGWGNADDFAATANLLSKVDVTIAATYAAAAEKRGKGTSDFMALMAAETWLTDEETIEIGLADAVAEGGDKNATAQARSRWDLSAFSRAPVAPKVADAPEPPPEAKVENAPDDPPPAVIDVEQSGDDDLDRRRRLAALLLKEPA